MTTEERVGRGKVVSVTYAMRDERGEIIEYVDIPVSYVHGAGGPLFPRIEEALEGRLVGDSVAVTLSPEDGFGARNPGLVFTDDLDNVPPDLRQTGARFEAEGPDGKHLEFVVTEIAGGRLTVDANHPFAGKTVSFDVTVRAIREASDTERRSGVPDTDPPTLQ